MGRRSCTLTIFEGVDGAGKTTAARIYAERINAKYVHFGPLYHVKSGVARMYVEAMLPALLGYQHVVFDRSWLSEEPYGLVFRGGKLRVSTTQQRILERLALRCGGLVVHCDPGWDTVSHNYNNRGGKEEMLDNQKQLKEVYALYQSMETELPKIIYDYKQDGPWMWMNEYRPPCHGLEYASAGSLQAKVTLVGEKFADHKNEDAWYQWPFGSLSDDGCSRWLTERLEFGGIRERDLYWINADQDLEHLLHGHTKVIALGAEAENRLEDVGVEIAASVPHPAYWRRFHHNEPYPLINTLQELLHNERCI